MGWSKEDLAWWHQMVLNSLEGELPLFKREGEPHARD